MAEVVVVVVGGDKLSEEEESAGMMSDGDVSCTDGDCAVGKGGREGVSSKHVKTRSMYSEYCSLGFGGTASRGVLSELLLVVVVVVVVVVEEEEEEGGVDGERAEARMAEARNELGG